MYGISVDHVVSTPSDQIPRSQAELVVTLIVGAVWLGCLVFAIRSGVRRRDPLGLLLMAGGALAVLQEPVVDVLGYVWVRSDLTVFTTFGRPMPVWAVLAYSIFWGFQPYAWWVLADRGLSRPLFRWMVVACFAVNLVIEWPILATGIYTYYGDQPFEILGFPLHWLFVNGVGVIATATVVVANRRWFTGWRVLMVVLVPPVATPGMSLASGLPVFSALHSSFDSLLVTSAGALMSATIAIVIIQQCTQLICSDGAPAPRTLGQHSRPRPTEIPPVSSASRSATRPRSQPTNASVRRCERSFDL